MKSLLLAALTLFAAVKNPDTYTHLTTSDIDTLDPAWSYDTSSHGIISNVYETLLTFQEKSVDMAPLLSTNVPKPGADGRTYVFNIRKGVKFHDGKVMTPEDVKYSLMRFMLLDRAGGPSALLLEPIAGTESTRDAQNKLLPDIWKRVDQAITIKGDTVTIKLAKPFAPFLSILGGFGAIVSKEFCVTNGDWDGSEAALARYNNPTKDKMVLHDKVNGTGPFKLERWDKKVKMVVMIRHDDYWRGPAKLKRVVHKAMEEFATRKLMLVAGDADSITSQLATLPQVRNLPGVQVIEKLPKLEAPSAIAFTFKMNPTANHNIGSGKLDGDGIPPDFFSDKDVRRAFAYLVDYDAYVNDLMHGGGVQAAGLIPPGVVGHWKRKPLYKYDLKKAEEHLKKAWGGQLWEKGMRFTLVAGEGQPGPLALANMIRKNIQSLNPKFKVDVRPIQWSLFLAQSQEKKIPFFLVNWAMDFPDPHNLAYTYYHSNGYFPGKQGYKNPKMDELVEKGVSELDSAKRAKIYQQLQALADEDLPHLVFTDGYRYRTQRTWVKGWKFHPMHPPDAPYGSDYYKLWKAE